MKQLRNRNKLNQRSKVVIICFVLMFITIGFAALSATLGINANTIVGKIVHDVHFENIAEIEGTMEAKVPAYIDATNKTQINFDLELTVPGQTYEFEADIVNSGTLDSMISSIDVVGMSEEAKKYLNISCTYYDGSEVKVNDALPAGSSDRIRVKLEFLFDISNEDLPPQGTSSNFSLNITFVQDPGIGVKRTKSYLFKLLNTYAPIDNMPSEYVTSAKGIDFSLDSTTLNEASERIVVSPSIDPSLKNGNGLYVRAGTENDEHPIFYYRGDVKDNNVLFSGYCWKIVRTTETGGTKLIYNGIPSSTNTCDNPTFEESLKTEYNTDNDSISDVGYMHGTSYSSQTEKFGASLYFTGYVSINSNSNYYYSTEAPTYSNKKYTLTNASQLNLETLDSTLPETNYYTCLGASSSECSIVYYVFAIEKPPIDSQAMILGGNDYRTLYYLQLTGGLTIDEVNINMSFGDSYTINSEGKFVLENIRQVNFIDWYDNYSLYKDKYVCSDGISTTCEEMGQVKEVTKTSFIYRTLVHYQFGNDVSYDEVTGQYTLQDTYDVTYDIDVNKALKESLNQRHYTCLSSSKACDKVYYILNVYYGMPSKSIAPRKGFSSEKLSSKIFRQDPGIYTMEYLSFSNGKKIESAKEDMIKNENDSIAKSTIDSWYEKRLIRYTNLLETDTVWCNNRTLLNGGMLGKDTNIFNYNNPLIFETYKNIYNAGLNLDTNQYDNTAVYYPLVKDAEACPNVNDQFTISTSNVGNKALKYPVGLLTAYELSLAGYGFSSLRISSTYLALKDDIYTYWTMTPMTFSGSSFVGYWSDYMSDKVVGASNMSRMIIGGNYDYARPSISLKPDIKLRTGDGTAEKPFIFLPEDQIIDVEMAPEP